MENIPDYQDGGEGMPAELFNQFKDEALNAITSLGTTPTSADLVQIIKTIAAYAGMGDYYLEGGAVNAYVLSLEGSRKEPVSYQKGLRIRFIPANTNTNINTTIKLGTLAALPVSDVLLANGETPVVSVSSIYQGHIVEYFYNETPDGLTKYWQLCKIKLNRLENGNMVIIDGNSTFTMNIGSTSRVFDTGTHLVELYQSNSEIRAQSLAKVGGLGTVSTLTTDSVSSENTETNKKLKTVVKPHGINYGGADHPAGVDPSPDISTVVIDLDGSGISYAGGSNPNWIAGSGILTNIPSSCAILNVSYRNSGFGSNYFTASCNAGLVLGAGAFWEITPHVYMNNVTGPIVTGAKLIVTFDASSLG